MSRVLVVDDEASMRAALDANFRRGGWHFVAPLSQAFSEQGFTRANQYLHEVAHIG